MLKKYTVWLFFLFLTGCQTIHNDNRSIATPETWQVNITSSINWMRSHMSNCMVNYPEVDLLVIESLPADLHRQTDAIQLRWGAPDSFDGYAAILGIEELLVVVHPDNPLENLTRAELQAIYTGKTIHWENLTAGGFEGAIQVWTYTSDEDIQTIFNRVIGTSKITSMAYIAPDSKAMMQAVAANTNAIGFIPGYWKNPTIRAVFITDIDDQVRLNPILAILNSEPHGSKKDWLLCIQESIQSELHYD